MRQPPNAELTKAVERAWARRAELGPGTQGPERDAVDAALAALDAGEARVAEKVAGQWVVREWLKKAVLLSFTLNDMALTDAGAGGPGGWDKVPSKFRGWDAARFRAAGFRAVPGAIVRHAAHIGPSVVLMPSFVNIGAYVGRGTMVDTWATIGSCAQIGSDCHISGGAGIGGVLEPLQAAPVIVEDNCFIGARSEVVEGVLVEEGAVIGMGVFIGASTKIIDRHTGAVTQGRVPAYSVVVAGAMPGGTGLEGGPRPGLSCAVIIKRVDERTRAKTAINELLRD